jgi:hypothetical protein
VDPAPGATHYEVLGVEPAASADAVKRAYRRRAMALHPDRRAGAGAIEQEQAHQALQRLNEAWRALRDPARRQAYDRTLAPPSRPAPPGARPCPPAPPRQPLLDEAFTPLVSAPWRPGGADGLFLSVDRPRDLWLLGRLPDGALRGLYAGDAWVDDEQLAHVAAQRRLRVLDLSGSSVTDAGIGHLLGLGELEDLRLQGTRVTDDGVARLASLAALTRLSLAETSVTDAGVAALAAAPSLATVDLRRTRVSSEGIVCLLEAPSLRSVVVPWHVRGRLRRRLRARRPGVTLV